jgi:hypothetical protein
LLCYSLLTIVGEGGFIWKREMGGMRVFKLSLRGGGKEVGWMIDFGRFYIVYLLWDFDEI